MTKQNKAKELISEDMLLFKKINKGDYEAITLLFKKYYKDLCNFGKTYETNIHVIEEKVADVFIALWDNKNKLNEINNPKSYLYVIVKNNLRKITTTHYVDTIRINNHFKTPSIEDEIIIKEQMEINKNIITNILDDIPKRTRQVFELSRIDGFKYKEISELLEISPKTVENHMGLALKYINKSMSKYKNK